MMKQGEIIDGFTPPPHPRGITLSGHLVRLEPLDADTHAESLYNANALDSAGDNWTYLPYGPFEDTASYTDWVETQAGGDDPVFFAIIRLSDARPVGVASYLRIHPDDASIEVGHIHFSPLLQQTTGATEAMYLMMKWAFEAGYRRYEWKCNALNIKSRNAAQRLGLSYEGVFRQMSVQKGRNRNTAWFAAIDKEWPALKSCFETYLHADNFDAQGRAKTSLSALTNPRLFKRDTLEFS